jgi:uncharacterized protein (DUF4213/DUF364 family)
VSVAETIRSLVLERGAGTPVRRVQVGLIYCAVQLETGTTGVAFTFPDQRSGQKMVEQLGSEDLVSSALALATANALIADSSGDSQTTVGDVLDQLDIREGDRLCMVGCFLPVLEKLKTASVQVTAVDQVVKAGAEPAENSERLLPESQVAIITGTSIINNTIDALLELAAGCREVAILGPSTPLLAEAFRDLPVHCLSGIRIDEPDAVFRIIGEGGGFRFFKDHTTKLNIPLH